MADEFKFKEKPAAKSSSGVLTNVPGEIVCPKCGHYPTKVQGPRWKGCDCKCHPFNQKEERKTGLHGRVLMFERKLL